MDKTTRKLFDSIHFTLDWIGEKNSHVTVEAVNSILQETMEKLTDLEVYGKPPVWDDGGFPCRPKPEYLPKKGK